MYLCRNDRLTFDASISVRKGKGGGGVDGLGRPPSPKQGHLHRPLDFFFSNRVSVFYINYAAVAGVSRISLRAVIKDRPGMISGGWGGGGGGGGGGCYPLKTQFIRKLGALLLFGIGPTLFFF